MKTRAFRIPGDQLTAVSSNVSITNYTAFDVLGRVKSSAQSVAGLTYTMPDYSYDLSGALISQTYPSGRVVITETDDIGRLERVASQVPNQVQRTLLSQIAYTSFGAVRQAKLGNGRWESAVFDAKRLQVEQIGLGGSMGNTSLLKLEFDYGTTNNNGTLLQQMITHPGVSSPIIQIYTYDHLNRLKSATESLNGVQQWKQTFSIDRFGNRRFDANNTTTLGSCPASICNPSFDITKNQFAPADGYTFNEEGSLTINPEGQTFIYDAENRQIQVNNSATQMVDYYGYDGNGKRVKKRVKNNQETIFVYDAFGKLVAEYTVNLPITQKGTQYITPDQFGSPRLVTNAIGGVVSRHDYMPFGEEIAPGLGGRIAPHGYSQTDNVRQKFTGYERDAETSLDFAQARYYSSKHARFTTTDPYLLSARTSFPQSLNRYSYGANNPYKYVDPLGLAPCAIPGGGNTACIEEVKAACPPGQTCLTDDYGEEYYVDGEGIWVYTRIIQIPAQRGCERDNSCKNKPPGLGIGPGIGVGIGIGAGGAGAGLGGAGGGLSAGAGLGGAIGSTGGTGSGGSGSSGLDSNKRQGKMNSISPETRAIHLQMAQNNAEIMRILGIHDGMIVDEDEILDLAQDYLGENQISDVRRSGRYLSADQTRVVRMTDGDLKRNHLNFEILTPNPVTGKMEVIVNFHVYFR